MDILKQIEELVKKYQEENKHHYITIRTPNKSNFYMLPTKDGKQDFTFNEVEIYVLSHIH